MKETLLALTIAALCAAALSSLADTRQARVDQSTGEVVDKRTVRDRVEQQRGLWVPLIEEAVPAYDPATQTIETTTEVAPDRLSVTVRKTVRQLTQEELDANAAAQAEEDADKTKRNGLRSLLPALDANTSTEIQRERAIARLIRLQYREAIEP